MKTKILPGLAIVLIIETGLTHLFSAPHEFEHAAYVGYLFIMNFIAALLAGYGIYRQKIWGWLLGVSLAAASIFAYILSRTIGLPGMEIEEWFSPIGLLALVVESLFILIIPFRPWRIDLKQDPQPKKSSLLNYSLPALCMFLMVAAIGVAVSVEGPTSHPENKHLASKAELAEVAPLSSFEFEQQYGVFVDQAIITGQGHLVNVRLQIVDPQKAATLLEGKAGLLVDEKAFIAAPGMYVHGDFRPGDKFVMYFPDLDRAVHAGSQISLVFDHTLVEPVIAQ